MEVIDTKSIQPTSSGHDSWPEAPDLQLDCFSSDDEEETIDESEPESTSSDDSSVKEIIKSPPITNPVLTETIANNNNSLDCKPGTSRTDLIPTNVVSSTVNNVSSSTGTSTGSVVPNPLIKCPETAASSSAPTDPVSKSGPVESVSSTAIASKLASRNGHLLIDLTNSDDESNNRNKSEQRRNSNAESAARRVHHARRSGRHLTGGTNQRMSCMQETPGSNITHRHHPANGFMPNGQVSHGSSSTHPFAPCRYLPQHQLLPSAQQSGSLQAPHTSSIPQSNIPELVNGGTGNNNSNPCSYSNCFVASPSNGNIAAAPPTGPCPHNQGYCPVPNTQHFLLPTNLTQQQQQPPPPPPQFVLPPHLIPPTNMVPNGRHHHHPMFYHAYTAQQQQQQLPPPAAHTRIPIPPFQSQPTNMSAAHLQTWLSQHRRAEMERQRYVQHEINNRNQYLHRLMLEQNTPVSLPQPPHTHQPTIPTMCPAFVEAHLAAAAWTGLGVHHPPPVGFNSSAPLGHPLAITMNPSINPFPANGAVGGQAATGGCGAESPVNTPELMDVNHFAPNGNGAQSSIPSQVQMPDQVPGLSAHDVLAAANDPSHAHIHHHVHQHHYHARNPIPPFPGYHYMVSKSYPFLVSVTQKSYSYRFQGQNSYPYPNWFLTIRSTCP